jgi:hypothetical protein
MPIPTPDEAALPLAEYLRRRSIVGAGALLSPRGCEAVAELMAACKAVRDAQLRTPAIDALVAHVDEMTREGML